MDAFISSLEDEIEDVEQEVFLLFSQTIPSNSLGFVDSKSEELVVSVGSHDFEIHQSPTLLNSDREAGTTGAVLWQITPRFARWMIDPANILFKQGLLGPESVILELGAGISGVLALSVAPMIKRYIVTDQDYLLRILRQNIAANFSLSNRSSSLRKTKGKSAAKADGGNIIVKSIDWETDDLNSFLSFSHLDPPLPGSRIDFVIACDCVYNESLVNPLVNTCAELCQLQPDDKPTLCIVAQQLRSPDVLETWLKAFHKRFRVWRMPGHLISNDLGEDSGFVVHVGLLKKGMYDVAR